MRFLGLAAALLLGACTAVPAGRTPLPQTAPTPAANRPVTAPVTAFRAPEVERIAGLEGVLQQDAAGLTRRFGNPRLDVREGDARKLQFAGTACVMDVFLYPLRQGAEPVATHVEARRASDGQDVDKAACAAALGR